MSRNKILTALLAALLMTLPCSFAESVNIIPDEMIKSNTVNYETHIAALGSYEQTYSSSGGEYYPYTYNVHPEVDGAKFVEYTVNKGQQVKKGDVLAVFALDVDEVRLTELQLEMERTQYDLERGVKLREESIAKLEEDLHGIRDRYEYECHALEIKRAKVELEQYVYLQKLAISNISDEIAEIEAEKTGAQLVAPADGVVVSTTLKREGDRVYQSESLVTLFQAEGKMICLENVANQFRYGMDVTIEVGSGKNMLQLEGRVVGTDSQVPEALRNNLVYVAFDDEGNDIRVAKVRVQGVSLDNVMIIPRDAVVLDAGSYYVTKLVNGVAQKRYINCIVKPGKQIWVLQGLEVGEEVIVD